MPGSPNSNPGELPTPPADGDADATIAHSSRASLPTPGPKPKLDGFELIEELGRGGMGVVYRARDKKLDRTVALKMILGGQFASQDEVRRFQIEAESAAQLDHPHIVPIYETGQSNGNHFFSMKLVDGWPLSERRDTYRDDPRKAVRLIIAIARAVHHAHQRGVLHRDLKPANVLVDEHDHAWLTDLGLAKQLEKDSGLTQTGLVMGSPGFMSPEQATGKTDVTTSIDVYSLGAILYWLVTGHAPFEGATPLDVILQTIEKEPQSLRAFVPSADRDLNLICQKALHKEPANRYASAEALANELEAWLDGEPLSVRPPSAFDVAKLWVRKNFRTVALALGSGVLCGLLVGTIVWLLMVKNEVAFADSYYPLIGGEHRTWVTNYFGWLRHIPRKLLFTLPFFVSWTTTLIGIVTIRLIQPKSREVSIAAAVTAALLAGIISFTISLGWGPISDYSIDRGKHDIELIADGFWMQDDAERDLATRSLMERYPGLQEVDRPRRGYLIYNKIINDQRIGIPWGMWLGIASAMCTTVVPLFCSALFAGLIWDKGHRGWQFVGMSFELGIYSALLFLILAKMVPNTVGTAPSLLFQSVTIGGIALALYWGLSEARVTWRILGFVLACVCVIMSFIESTRIDSANRLAFRAESAQDLQNAAEYFEKKLLRDGGSYERFQVTVIYAYLRDDENYASQCQQMLSSFTYAYRANVAERIAKACLLKPQLVPDIEKAHELAELVSGYDSSYDRRWLSFVRAMSEMRKGHLAETQSWCEQSRVDASSENGLAYFVATTHVLEALASQSADEDTRAHECLLAADAALDVDRGKSLGSWVDRLIYKTLRREADEKLIVSAADR